MNKRARVIARLDIKAPNLIKGIHLEGLRVVGAPHDFARKYYEQGADELLYIDIVASLYGRNTINDIVAQTAQDIFIPVTVGGGLKSIEDVARVLRSGADKVAINTAATQRPSLISEVANRYGSQCMVLSIEAKRRPGASGWECFTDNGREHTELDVLEWARQGEKLGAGELLITSVDQEGTRRGMDLELIKAVTDAVSIPVIASGGVGSPQHVTDAVNKAGADAVAVADCLHYSRFSIKDFKNASREAGIEVRHL